MRRSTVSSLKAAARLVGFVLVCQLAGAIGAWTTVTGDSAWYEALRKPFFTPPDWLFAPVWITLYSLMGIAAALVYQRGLKRWGTKSALALFAVQLALNAAWTPIFFGAHAIAEGAVVIVLLWLVLAWTIRRFFLVHRTAGWLLVPYLAWVTYAAALNIAILYLNPP